MAAPVGERPNLSGYWKLKRNDENFDKYLRAQGLNFVMRKMISAATMYQDIEQEDDKFTVKVILPVSTQEMKFTVDEPFEFFHNFQKVTVNRIATWDGNALVLKSPNEGADQQTERRELADDGMLVLTITKGDIETKRYFEKAEKKAEKKK